MAKSANLHALYSYLYSTASKWVHFSPQILLRMGWGGAKDDVGDHTERTFTAANFSQYYVEFNKTYSLLLLLRLLRGPAATLIPQAAQKVVAALENRLRGGPGNPDSVVSGSLA
jgi:hypothetical protein